MVSYKMQTPTDSKLVDGSVYSVISEHWVHSEQIRWTLLSNFLTANSILLVAWATIYVADGRPPPWARTCVLVAFASAGLFLSLVWVGIVLRSSKFVKMHIDFGCKAEGQMQPEAERQMQPFQVPLLQLKFFRSNIKGLPRLPDPPEFCWQSQSFLPFSTFSLVRPLPRFSRPTMNS